MIGSWPVGKVARKVKPPRILVLATRSRERLELIRNRVPLEIADKFLTNVNNIWSFNPLLTAVINKFLTKAPEKLLTG